MLIWELWMVALAAIRANKLRSFLTMLGIIGTFKSFNSVYILAHPGAGTTVNTLSLDIFDIFFSSSRFGYAAAESLFLFVLVIGLTYVQRHFLERRVQYGD